MEKNLVRVILINGEIDWRFSKEIVEFSEKDIDKIQAALADVSEFVGNYHKLIKNRRKMNE